MIFDVHNAQEFADLLNTEIAAPFVFAKVDSLGGRPSILVRVSLQSEHEWTNGIYHNSPGFMLHLFQEGTVEQFYTHGLKKKFRKRFVKSWSEAVKKINQYLDEAEAEPRRRR